METSAADENAIAFVHTGDASLKGEVLRVQGRRADLQIFEETQGVRVGDRVEPTSQMLSATRTRTAGRSTTACKIL